MAMGYLEVLFFIPFFLMPLLAVAQNQNSTAESLLFPKQYCILQRGNYTDNSTYQADLDGLLSSFSNTTVDFGFYNSSAGEVNAMGLCRADLTPDSCRTCINSSVHVLRRSCPNYKEAIIYNRTCMLRYSDRSIFGIWESNPLLITFTFRHFTNVSQTKPTVLKLLTHLYDEAASGGPLRKYAVGEAVSGFESIYALVQCTPNLPKQKCRDCLEDLHEAVPYRFERSGLFLIGPSCNFRYASFRFYQSVSDGPSSSPSPSSSLSPSPSPSPSPTPTTNDTTGNGKNKRRSIIIAAVSTVASVVLIFCICVCIYIFIFSKVGKSKEQDEDMGEIMSIESLQLDLNSVKVATANFSDANKLGQGGFGDVYKGKLPNGQDIVVKSLSKDSRQGELEFKNEVLLVAKLQHRNLVRLLGFCLEGTEKILIYEFVPNASLDQFIFDPIKSSQLNWQRRYKIIEGIARGLVYLHEDSRVQIIHRDLKASNILLDEEMSPKISDFGMARIFLTDQTQDTTMRVVGSNGYMAPEYAMNGKFSSKSDVYSFGVLTLEIVSGQKNSSSQNGEDIEDLLNFAWKSWSMGTISNFIDPVLRSSLRSEAVARCIQIALLCVQENVVDRPTMASVILMLSSDSLPLPTPSRPSLFMSHSIQQESSIVEV